MIGLQNKVNIDNSNPADYPFGNIKDNDGSNNGTPIDVNTYADIHQFFEVLLFQVGMVPNGQYDNATNNYQTILALTAFIRKTFATDTARGTVELATQAEVNTGTDTDRAITPATLAAAATVVVDEGKLGMKTKVVNIGTWDMPAAPTKVVAHGLADFTKIREVSVLIRNDAADKIYPLTFQVTGVHPVMGGHISEINATNVVLRRISTTEAADFVTTGTGLFMSTDFDETTGSYNRGWVIIKHIA